MQFGPRGICSASSQALHCRPRRDARCRPMDVFGLFSAKHFCIGNGILKYRPRTRRLYPRYPLPQRDERRDPRHLRCSALRWSLPQWIKPSDLSRLVSSTLMDRPASPSSAPRARPCRPRRRCCPRQARGGASSLCGGASPSCASSSSLPRSPSGPRRRWWRAEPLPA